MPEVLSIILPVSVYNQSVSHIQTPSVFVNIYLIQCPVVHMRFGHQENINIGITTSTLIATTTTTTNTTHTLVDVQPTRITTTYTITTTTTTTSTTSSISQLDISFDFDSKDIDELINNIALPSHHMSSPTPLQVPPSEFQNVHEEPNSDEEAMMGEFLDGW